MERITVIFLFLWLGSFFFATGLELGTLSEDTYYQSVVIVAYDNVGLKTCGRHCLYQDQCSAINFTPETLVCELLDTGGTSQSVTGSLYSPINSWTMENDPCHPNPCTGKQKCVKTVDYRYYCQTLSTPCDAVVCQNGGSCSNGVSSFQCFCPAGFSGTYCQVTPCTAAPCINGGTCSVTGSTYSCACLSAYYGTNCDQSVCDTTPCKNSGTCSPLSLSTYSCACASGYSGEQCQYYLSTTYSLTSVYYTDNMNTQYGPWTVTTGYRVAVRFTKMDVEANYDYVKVYDGVTNTLLASRTGPNLGSEVITSGNSVYIVFTTDHSITLTGFTMDIYRLG